MAKYRGPRAKISRKFGVPILGCEKVLKRKKYPPGQHGKKRKRKSEYAIQLAEKQKARYTYGLLERQFRNLVKEAEARPGVSGDVLMQLLERRLDNVVVRLGISPTHAAARQLVVHCHVHVNGRVVNRPSYPLKAGDVVALSSRARSFPMVQTQLNTVEERVPWLIWDAQQFEGTLLEVPERAQIPTKIQERVIIEFYAR